MTWAGAQCELVAGELLVAKAHSDRSLCMLNWLLNIFLFPLIAHFLFQKS